MKYLEIENGKISGWVIPMYYHNALEFANEVRKVCAIGSTGNGVIDTSNGKVKVHFTNYKHKDGTRFVLSYNNEDELIEIEAKDIFSEDFDTVYYNAG